ncbi:hypothetical protein AB0F15_03050 [Amycolatopsis sp. NPDC026612]|uniref:hypothetical protein n=1 Tax=Amycolatopsis sp. NPDC026612 TaxID=3155466 RepID=UPI0033D1B1E1
MGALWVGLDLAHSGSPSADGAGVPAGEKFSLVEVSHRGRIMVQPEDARTGKVALSLGS